MEEIKRKTSFAEQVYALCSQIPLGKVTTYREIAQKLGCRGYRAVGQALRCNPYAPFVPCHRVVRSDGSLGGFKGKMNGRELREKIVLLHTERVMVLDGRVDLSRYLFRF